jgi:glycosyl transferase family 25
MPIYLINLDRRPDRLATMTDRLVSLGLTATRIAALDAQTVSDDWLSKTFAGSGPLGELPKGDRCCSLSHRQAWAAFVATGAPFAVMLEDDIVLEPAAARLLADTDWIPPGIDVVKLEHFGPAHQRVLVGGARSVGSGHSLAPILSRHTGAGAYLLSRAAAAKLLTIERWTVPVDHLLFNPNVSPLAAQLTPFQMLPAIARQSADPSDIRPWRLADRTLDYKRARREIVRAYYECRLLPRQVAAVLAGHARLARVAAPTS